MKANIDEKQLSRFNKHLDIYKYGIICNGTLYVNSIFMMEPNDGNDYIMVMFNRDKILNLQIHKNTQYPEDFIKFCKKVIKENESTKNN